jgi:hypothetical protein
MFKPVRQQEAVGCNAQSNVMMKAAPTPSLVVAQTELLFEILIIAFNAPAHLGGLDQRCCPMGNGSAWSEPMPVFSRSDYWSI